MTEDIVVRRRDERYTILPTAAEVLPEVELAVYEVMREVAQPMTHRDLTHTMWEQGYEWNDRTARDACLRLVKKGWVRRNRKTIMGPNGPETTFFALRYRARVEVDA